MELNLQIVEIGFQTIVALTAVGSLIVAIISYKRSSRLKERQIRLQEKQEELIDLQLKQHKRILENEKHEPALDKKADIRVSLERAGRHARFVIRNWGEAAANNVDLSVKPVDGHTSPISDTEATLPIPRLSPGADYSLMAAITYDSGTTFDVSWNWEELDGTKANESSRLSI